MARKRMFDTEIIGADSFLEMPPSTQNLYFHLSMRADDDGFVSNPKQIIDMTKATQDDFKVLLAKKYIIPFESGICVIRHWRINNYLRSDRYHPTIHIEEKEQLKLEKSGAYSLQDERYTTGIPSGIPSIDKYSIDSNNIYKIVEEEFGRPISPMEMQVIDSWNFPAEMIKLAIKEAVTSNNCAIKYIDKILYNWEKKGIKSVADAEKSIADFKRLKERKEKYNLPAKEPEIAGASYYRRLE